MYLFKKKLSNDSGAIYIVSSASNTTKKKKILLIFIQNNYSNIDSNILIKMLTWNKGYTRRTLLIIYVDIIFVYINYDNYEL